MYYRLDSESQMYHDYVQYKKDVYARENNLRQLSGVVAEFVPEIRAHWWDDGVTWVAKGRKLGIKADETLYIYVIKDYVTLSGNVWVFDESTDLYKALMDKLDRKLFKAVQEEEASISQREQLLFPLSDDKAELMTFTLHENLQCYLVGSEDYQLNKYGEELGYKPLTVEDLREIAGGYRPWIK